MTFNEVLSQTIAMLHQHGCVSYRALKRQFAIDDDYLADLTDAILFAHPRVSDEEGRGLVWIGDASTVPLGTDAAAREQTPLAYTPPPLAEKIFTARRALEGERKHVTVLFADLKGSTELIRGLDPEAAQKLLDPALQRMMDAVHRFEGTVNQVLGDGIMALFGAPIAHEDHALRACYAALAMQTELRRYAEEVRRTQGLEVQLRVGLNSGDVVVRTIGNDLHMDYSAVGQTTHLAARMEQLATSGTIRLPAATLRLVESLVRVNALGPIPVKGLAEPVEVFELLGATPVRRRLQAAVARGLTRSLLLDSGVFGSNVVREGQCFFKTIEKEGLQGGKGDEHEVEQPQHIHDPGIQQEPRGNVKNAPGFLRHMIRRFSFSYQRRPDTAGQQSGC